MNEQGNGPKPGIQTTEFWTWVASIIVAVALAKGWITQSQADAANAQAQTVGAVLIILVTSATYILSRFGLKFPWMQVLAYTTPSLTQEPSVTAATPVVAAPTPPTEKPAPVADTPVQTVPVVPATADAT